MDRWISNRPTVPLATAEPTWLGIGLFVALFVAILAFFVSDAKFSVSTSDLPWNTFSAPVRIVR
jgi:hypothetical protein